jgi:hypothetical protein
VLAVGRNGSTFRGGVGVIVQASSDSNNRPAEALTAIEKAVQLNPYNARTAGLPSNATFEPLRSDPKWVRIMSVWPLEDPCLCRDLPKR